MKRSLFIITLLSTLYLSGCGENGKVIGKVTSADGKAISGVAVSIDNQQFFTTTDSNGEYSIEFVPGEFGVLFNKDGFTSDSLTINVATNIDYPAKTIVLIKSNSSPERLAKDFSRRLRGDDYKTNVLIDTLYYSENRMIILSYFKGKMEESVYIEFEKNYPKEVDEAFYTSLEYVRNILKESNIKLTDLTYSCKNKLKKTFKLSTCKSNSFPVNGGSKSVVLDMVDANGSYYIRFVGTAI